MARQRNLDQIQCTLDVRGKTEQEAKSGSSRADVKDRIYHGFGPVLPHLDVAIGKRSDYLDRLQNPTKNWEISIAGPTFLFLASIRPALGLDLKFPDGSRG